MVDLQIVSKEDFLQYFKKLRVGLIEYSELGKALRSMENRKACRIDGLKADMFKYASVNLKQRFLKFLKHTHRVLCNKEVCS